MIPLEINPEQLPAICARIGFQESSLSALLGNAAAPATPLPTGPHWPGLYMSAGFSILQTVLFTYLEAGVVEKLNGGETLVPISQSYQSGDDCGGSTVTSAGAVFSSGTP